MTVLADCSDCESKHPLSRRKLEEDYITSHCPECGSKSYETYSENIVIEEEAGKIRNAIEDIPGVGKSTRENITSTYTTMNQLKAARGRELEEIEGVGETVAKRMQEKL